jgi:hypothetical protein
MYSIMQAFIVFLFVCLFVGLEACQILGLLAPVYLNREYLDGVWPNIVPTLEKVLI